MAFVGVRPVLTQVPPKSLRSTTATFIPAAVKRFARFGPACPVPMMIASNCVVMHALSRRSSGKNVKDLLHAAVGGGRRLLRIAAALTRAQVGRVPVPPVVLGVRLLVVVVVLRCLAEQPCHRCHVPAWCLGQ